MFIRITASAFRKLLTIYVFSYFPFVFEGRMWDLIVSVPDHYLSLYFSRKLLWEFGVVKNLHLLQVFSRTVFFLEEMYCGRSAF